MAKSINGSLVWDTAKNGDRLAYWRIRLTSIDGKKIRLLISRGVKPNRSLEEREFKEYQRSEHKAQYLIDLGYKDLLIEKRIISPESTDISDCPTLEDFSPVYLKWATGRTLTGDGIRRANFTLKTLNKHLGKLPLTAITPIAVDKFVDAHKVELSQYGRPYSPKTINNDVTQLSGIMEAALKMGIIERHPFKSDSRKLTSYFLKTQKKKPTVLLPEEIEAMVKACEGKPYRGAAFMFFILTGGRLQEITKLKFADCDLVNGRITLEADKTDDFRTIEIGPELVELLTFMRSYWPDRFRWRPRKTKQMEYVFCTPEGTRIKKGVGSVFIKQIAKDAGLNKHVTAHSLRHVNAGYLRSFLTTYQLQKHLGHHNSSTTEKYGQVLDSTMRIGADKLGTSMGLQLQNLTLLKTDKDLPTRKTRNLGQPVGNPDNFQKTASKTVTGKHEMVEVVGIEPTS